MKKLLLICIISILFTGCEKGVSQEKYDTILNNLQILRTEHDELNVKYNELLSQNEILIESNNELEQLNQETIDSLTNITNKYTEVSAENGDIVIEAWGNVAFGDNTDYSILDQSTVQYKTYLNEVSDATIKNWLTSLTDNIGLLKVIAPQKEFSFVYIKAVNNDSSPIFEMFIDLSDLDNVQTSMITESTYNNMISRALDGLQ